MTKEYDLIVIGGGSGGRVGVGLGGVRRLGQSATMVAARVGKKLDWDSKNLKAKNCPEADKYIRKTYRKGWVLNG